MPKHNSSVCSLTVQVTDSDLFERDGFDVHSDTDVSFTQAILGGELKIPGLSGHIMLKVHVHVVAMPQLIFMSCSHSDTCWSSVTSSHQVNQ